MTNKYNYQILIIIFITLFFSCQTDKIINITSLDGITVKISSPNNFEAVSPNQQLHFKGIVNSKSSSDLNNLKVNWLSDKDGLLFEGKLENGGETSFYLNKLSNNIHKIKLNIINEIDSITSDSIEIYNVIKLYPIEKTNNSSTITWSSVKDPNFQSYELYRCNYKNCILEGAPIYVTKNIQDTTFVDTTAVLGEKNLYKVLLTRNSPDYNKIGSNIDSVYAGKFIKNNFPILRLIRDPKKNYAYGIANVDNYTTNKNMFGLVIINLDKLEIETRILQDIRFRDFAIDSNANYLYACSKNNSIYKIDLNTRSLESILPNSPVGNFIEIANNGFLYACSPFSVYNLNTNTYISYNYNITPTQSSFEYGDFKIDTNNIIYHGQSNNSSSRLSKIDTNNNTFSIIKQWESHEYGADKITLSNDKLYWGHYQFDTNLKLLGTFKNERDYIDIKDVSPNGEYALGWGYDIFKTNNRSVFKKIPTFYEDGIFTNDNQVLIYRNDHPYYEQFESIIFIYDFKKK